MAGVYLSIWAMANVDDPTPVPREYCLGVALLSFLPWVGAAISWRWEAVGGVLFVLQSLVPYMFAGFYSPGVGLLCVLLAIYWPLAVGVLFLASWQLSRTAAPPEAILGTPYTEQPLARLEGKTFGIRAGAYIIDMIALIGTGFSVGFLWGPFLDVLSAIGGQEILFDEQLVPWFEWISGLVRALSYFILFEWLFGASPGKLILGMRVVQEDGTSCTLRAAIVRGILRYIDGIFFGLVAYASMRKGPLRQRLGDKGARTIVVDRGDSVIQEPRGWSWFLIAAVLYCGLASLTVSLRLVAALR